LLKKKRKFYKTISFNSWIYFFAFSIAIILLIVIFQLYLFEPAYLKLEKNQVSEEITKIIDINNSDEYNVAEKHYRIDIEAIRNEFCIVILNDNGNVYVSEGMREHTTQLYYLNESKEKILDIKYIDLLFENNNSNFVRTTPGYNEVDHLIYKYYDVNSKNTYYVDVTLQSVNNILKTTQSQLINMMIIILIMSFVMSILLSKLISNPIVKINTEAEKLASGKFELDLKHTNIYEFDELIDTLNISAKELSDLDNIKTEIVQNVAHDIRTPLTMIKAYAELLRDFSYDDKEKRNEHLGIIIDETDNLTDFVGKILNLSKLEKGINKLQMEEFDLTTLVNKTVQRISTTIIHEGIKIELDCEPELVAIGDLVNIREVLNNFISNAVNHVGSDKKVFVKAYQKSIDTVMIEIKDNGDGINPDLMPKIWDRYIKGNKQYQRSNQSHGLGLAINKAILEAHNSNYGVESTVGLGTKFYFSLKSSLK